MNKKVYCSIRLLDTIIDIIEKHNQDKSDREIKNSHIADIAEVVNNKSLKKLMYNIAGRDRKKIAKVLIFLLANISDCNKDILLNEINNDESIYLFSNEEIQAFQSRFTPKDEGEKVSYCNALESGHVNGTEEEYLYHSGNNIGNMYFYSMYNKEKNIIYLDDLIEYDMREAVFRNIENGKEYNIKGHRDYEVMMNILIRNKGSYVEYSRFQDMETLKPEETSTNRTREKRLTDIKNNLVGLLEKHLELPCKPNFILVHNGLKIV